MPSRFLTALTVLALALSLSACIEVDYIGDAWDKAVIDPVLEGEWLMQKSGSQSRQAVEAYVFLKQGDHYSVSPTAEKEDPMLARTLQIGAHNFLLMRDPKDSKDASGMSTSQSGALWRYKIEGETLTFFNLKQDMTEQVKEIGKDIVKPRQAGETKLFAVERLDENTLTALTALADDESYWETWASGQKVVVEEEKKE